MGVFIAMHYVRNGSVTYTPGEVFEADFDAAEVKRLTGIGAIRVTGEKYVPEYAEDEPEAELPMTEEDDIEEISPDVDVMDAIGMQTEEAPKAPKRRRSR